MVTNPKVDSFRETSKGFRGPRDVRIAVRRQHGVLRPKTIILLLCVSYDFGLYVLTDVIGRADEFKSFKERQTLHVSRGKTEGIGW